MAIFNSFLYVYQRLPWQIGVGRLVSTSASRFSLVQVLRAELCWKPPLPQPLVAMAFKKRPIVSWGLNFHCWVGCLVHHFSAAGGDGCAEVLAGRRGPRCMGHFGTLIFYPQAIKHVQGKGGLSCYQGAGCGKSGLAGQHIKGLENNFADSRVVCWRISKLQ